MQSTTRATLGQLSSKASQAALQCNPPQEQLLGSCPLRHLKLHYNAIHHKSNPWAAVLQGISSWTTMQSTTRATLGQLSSKASQAALQCNPPQEQPLGSCPPRHLKLHYNAIHHKSNSWAAVLQGISSCTTMQSTTRATLGQLSSKASQAELQCNPPQEQPLGSCPPRHLKLNYNAIHHKSNSWAAVLQGISSCTTMQSTTRATLGQLSSKASQAALQCNPPQEQCFFSGWAVCHGPEPLKLRLIQEFDAMGEDEIQFKQWTSTDRSNLETNILPAEEFVTLHW